MWSEIVGNQELNTNLGVTVNPCGSMERHRLYMGVLVDFSLYKTCE